MQEALKLTKYIAPIFTTGTKDYINTQRASRPKEGVLFYNFINETIERKAKRMRVGYKDNYFNK